MRALVALVLLWPGLAHGWPAESGWVPLRQGDAPLEDVGSDHTEGASYLDLDGTAKAPVAFIHADDDSLHLRLQVGGDPELDATHLQPFTWGFLVDTDGDPDDLEAMLLSSGAAGSVEIYAGDGTDGTAPGVSALTWVGSYGDLASGAVRAVRGSGTYWTVDLSISRTDWLDATGVDLADPMRLAVVTGTSAFSDWLDVAACDGAASCADLAPVLSDPVFIDGDMDGWTDAEEEVLGSDPDDADTDDDGLLDGEESVLDPDADDGPGFADCDTDGDGVLDGTEAGVTTAHEDTDPAAGCFVADADGTTTTDPGDPDTDGGGLRDGQEDWNFSGAIDCWETDPEDGDDDEDTDEDGIPDALEAGLDPDGDEVDSAVDLDSDDDGIPDVEEWPADTDGDCIPDFIETDADDDGILDEVEGGGDTDEDGIPDFQDDDSDGDGRPDVEEGDDDRDCDGIPDFQDRDDWDGECDTAEPEVDTGPYDTGNGLDPLQFPGGDYTGGACSTLPGAAWLLPALLAALALVGRRRSAAVAAGLLLLPVARAQDIDAQRFSASVDGRAFVKVEDAALAPAGAWGAGLWVNHADDPFVFRYADDRDDLDILGTVTTTSLVGFYSLGRARVGLDLPVHLYTDGFMVARPTHLGDFRLSTKAVILPELGLAAALDLGLPTGAPAAWVGAGTARAHLRVVEAMDLGPVRVAANLGLRTGTGERVGDLRVAPALTWAAAGSLAVTDRLTALVELDGELWLRATSEAGARPMEVLGAARFNPAGDLVATVGIGAGTSKGVGSPDVRLVAGVSWTPGPPGAEPILVVVPPVEELSDEPAAVQGALVIRAVGPTGRSISRASVRVLGTLGQSMKSGSDGILEAKLPPGDYEVVVAAEGWSTEQRRVEVEADEVTDIMVVCRPEQVIIDTESGQIYLTDKIFFELDKAELRVESVQTLDDLVGILLEHVEIEKLRIEGHTDAQGAEDYNLGLSEARAQAVVDYLIRSGIDAGRVEAVGYGETRLLQQGDSDAVHATNRRVEFHIVSRAGPE